MRVDDVARRRSALHDHHPNRWTYANRRRSGAL